MIGPVTARHNCATFKSRIKHSTNALLIRVDFVCENGIDLINQQRRRMCVQLAEENSFGWLDGVPRLRTEIPKTVEESRLPAQFDWQQPCWTFQGLSV
jgi:hypothetical protein